MPSDEHPCHNDKQCTTCRTKKSLYDWSLLFEKAYCICLVDRDDRLHESMRQFHDVGLCSNMIYYRPQKDTSTHVARPGARGCWESHRQIFIRARRAGYTKICVFEDDVVFEKKRIDSSTIKRIQMFITQQKKQWEIFFLGHFPLFTVPTVTMRIHRVFSAWMHAYIIRLDSKFVDWVVQTPYDALLKDRQLGPLANILSGGKDPPCMDMYAAYFAKSYAIFPQIAFQSGSETSNTKPGPALNRIVSNYISKYPRQSQTFAEVVTYVLFWLIVIIVVVIIIKVSQRHIFKSK